MRDKSLAVTTEEMWRKLFASPDIDSYFEGEDDGGLPAFDEYIRELCEASGEKPEQVLRRGNVESSFGHRVFSGKRRASRDTVLQLAFGFRMDVDETQQLLKVARMARLHPKVKRDAVIAYCLHNGRSIVETQQLLFDNGLPVIGGGRSA